MQSMLAPEPSVIRMAYTSGLTEHIYQPRQTASNSGIPFAYFKFQKRVVSPPLALVYCEIVSNCSTIDIFIHGPPVFPQELHSILSVRTRPGMAVDVRIDTMLGRYDPELMGCVVVHHARYTIHDTRGPGELDLVHFETRKVLDIRAG